MKQLTDADLAMFELERSLWKYAGAKETAIRERLHWSATRHYQRLNRLIDEPAALAHDPLLVKRLRRLRDQRRDARSTRRLA